MKESLEEASDVQTEVLTAEDLELTELNHSIYAKAAVMLRV
jgi:hypothetical protein